ncbi:hypothetical protein EON80_15710 [bacterium]|nr:MAG: hypothetical protein EON80_15710 [bacterium]
MIYPTPGSRKAIEKVLIEPRHPADGGQNERAYAPQAKDENEFFLDAAGDLDSGTHAPTNEQSQQGNANGCQDENQQHCAPPGKTEKCHFPSARQQFLAPRDEIYRVIQVLVRRVLHIGTSQSFNRLSDRVINLAMHINLTEVLRRPIGNFPARALAGDEVVQVRKDGGAVG